MGMNIILSILKDLMSNKSLIRLDEREDSLIKDWDINNCSSKVYVCLETEDKSHFYQEYHIDKEYFIKSMKDFISKIDIVE